VFREQDGDKLQGAVVSDYFLTPVESMGQAYYMKPVESSAQTYYMIPKNSPEEEGWIYYGTGGLSASEMTDSTTNPWSSNPGDYVNAAKKVALPDGAVKVRLRPLSGAQCFHDTAPERWTVRIKFKTIKQVKSLDSYELFGDQTTKSAAEDDYLKHGPIELAIGPDKKLAWGFSDFPLSDNTNDKAFFNIYYWKE